MKLPMPQNTCLAPSQPLQFGVLQSLQPGLLPASPRDWNFVLSPHFLSAISWTLLSTRE